MKINFVFNKIFKSNFFALKFFKNFVKGEFFKNFFQKQKSGLSRDGEFILEILVVGL